MYPLVQLFIDASDVCIYPPDGFLYYFILSHGDFKSWTVILFFYYFSRVSDLYILIIPYILVLKKSLNILNSLCVYYMKRS